MSPSGPDPAPFSPGFLAPAGSETTMQSTNAGNAIHGHRARFMTTLLVHPNQQAAFTRSEGRKRAIQRVAAKDRTVCSRSWTNPPPHLSCPEIQRDRNLASYLARPLIRHTHELAGRPGARGQPLSQIFSSLGESPLQDCEILFELDRGIGNRRVATHVQLPQGRT